MKPFCLASGGLLKALIFHSLTYLLTYLLIHSFACFSTIMESLVSKEDATVKELTLILREWVVIWKQLYKVNE